MSARNYSQVLTAGQTIRLPGGRFFFVRVASAVLDITAEGNTSAPVEFLGVAAGSKFGPVKEGEGWRTLRVTSATAQAIEIVISDDGNFDVASTVTVSGAVTIAEAPSTSIAIVDNTTVPPTSSVNISANPLRKRITINNDLNSATHLWVRDQSSTASGGIQLQPGQFVELKTAAAIRLRNNDGALSANYSTLEEV